MRVRFAKSGLFIRTVYVKIEIGVRVTTPSSNRSQRLFRLFVLWITFLAEFRYTNTFKTCPFKRHIFNIYF